MYVHGKPTETTPQDSYQKRQHQVLCECVLELFLADLSILPLYYKSQLGTHNGNNWTEKSIRNTSRAYGTEIKNSSVQSTAAYTQNHIDHLNRGMNMQDYPALKANLIILVTP